MLKNILYAVLTVILPVVIGAGAYAHHRSSPLPVKDSLQVSFKLRLDTCIAYPGFVPVDLEVINRSDQDYWVTGKWITVRTIKDENGRKLEPKNGMWKPRQLTEVLYHLVKRHDKIIIRVWMNDFSNYDLKEGQKYTAQLEYVNDHMNRKYKGVKTWRGIFPLGDLTVCTTKQLDLKIMDSVYKKIYFPADSK
jgi:hypothetical protein